MRRLLVLVFCAWSLLVSAQQQRVETVLSTNRVSEGESVVMNVRAVGLDAELDVSSLNNDFDVTSRSSSRQVTIENGRRSSTVEWVLELVPKRTGVLEVPAVSVGDEQSLPLTLLVEQAASGAARDLFLQASVDTIEPYVQSQVIYTVRVFQDVRFLDASLSNPELSNATIQQLGEEKSYQETVQGRPYTVTEIRYVVFPQKSGEVVIPSVVLNAVVTAEKNPQPNTRIRTRRLTRKADDIVLNVKPRPDSATGSWWLPARDVTLQSEWSEPIDNVTVDQPLTRTVYLMAQGVGDAQLPELVVPEVDNVSVYADTPTAVTNAGEQGLRAQQTNTWAVIPQSPGQWVMPEIQVNWFDTRTGETKVAVLPEEVITVIADGGTEANVEQVASANAGSDISNGDENATMVDANNSGVLPTGSEASDTDALAEELTDAQQNAPSSNASNQTASATDAALLAPLDSNAIDAMLAQTNRWRLATFVLLGTWCLSLIGFLWWHSQSKRTKQLPSDTVSATEKFRRRAGSRVSLSEIAVACESGSADEVSSSVMQWAAAVWPVNPPTSLQDVGRRLDSAELLGAFQSVDAARFRSSENVNTMTFSTIPDMLKRAVDQHEEPPQKDQSLHSLPTL